MYNLSNINENFDECIELISQFDIKEAKKFWINKLKISNYMKVKLLNYFNLF